MSTRYICQHFEVYLSTICGIFVNNNTTRDSARLIPPQSYFRNRIRENEMRGAAWEYIHIMRLHLSFMCYIAFVLPAVPKTTDCNIIEFCSIVIRGTVSVHYLNI